MRLSLLILLSEKLLHSSLREHGPLNRSRQFLLQLVHHTRRVDVHTTFSFGSLRGGADRDSIWFSSGGSDL